MAKELSEQTDPQLLVLFQRTRDQDAFANLVARHHGMIYGVAKRMLGCSHAAEDVVQATFLVLAKDASKIRKRTSLASWLYGVAFRIAARSAKQRAKANVQPLEGEVMIDADPLEKLSEQFEQNTVFEELYQLPERVRTPMVLRYLQGKSNAEVADELNLSQSAVEGRLKRGRNQLRLRLARQGVAFTVGVAILNAIRQDAVADEMTRQLADSIAAGVTGGVTTGTEIVRNEPMRLAEQEMMKMFTAKVLTGAWVTAAALCVAVVGWGLAGNAIAFGQGTDPFGEVTIVEAPFDGETLEDPFDISSKPTTSDAFVATPKQVETAKNPLQDNIFGFGASEKATAPTLFERMRKMGHYGIGSETEAEVRILEVLASKHSSARLEFNDEPLRNVAAVIAERHNIQILFDHTALEDENIDPASDSVTIDVKNVRLQSALNLILDRLNLATVVRDEVLMITSKEAAENNLTTRLYKMPDHWKVTAEELVAAITSITSPDSWNSVGGPGTIKTVPGGLFISNSHDVHLEVNELFAQLDKLYDEPAESR